jgi:hypothetical protein
MTAERLHLLAQAALCYEQAGQPAEAARCRDSAGEPVAAAELYRAAGELVKAADCYRRAGRTGAAASCLLTLGRAEDAAQLLRDSGNHLEAAWTLAVDADQPGRARGLLADVTAAGTGEELRLRIAVALCAVPDRRTAELANVLGDIEDELARVAPASEQVTLTRWAVRAADQIRRPDLGSRVFAAAYRCRLPGTTARWREWARTALGGTAGIPERDL